MMNRHLMAGILVSGAAALMAFGAARAGPERAEVVRAKLTHTALKSPQATMVQSDGSAVSLFNGMIYQNLPQPLEFSGKQLERMIMLGGTRVTLSLDEQGYLLKAGDKTMRLQKQSENEMSFRPQTLSIGTGREYVLAFPYGYSGKMRSTPNGPDELRGWLMYRSGSVQQAEIDGVRIAFFDANADGFYRKMDDGVAILPADAPFAVFARLGSVFATPKGVYRVRRLAEDGSELSYVPYAQPTGRMSLTFESKTLDAAVALVSSDADMSVAAPCGTAPLAVAPGTYRLQYGAVYSADLKRPVASITAGTMSAVQVSAGSDVQAVALGGPFKMTFQPQVERNQLVISSATFDLRGKGGEKYENFRFAAEPQIALVAGGKTTPLGKMEFG